MKTPIRVVLLPGMHGTKDLFDQFVAVAPPEFPCLPLSLPSDVSDYAVLVRLIRHQLPETGPFIVVGESFSGPIALALGHGRINNLKGVVLVNSFIEPPRSSLWKLLPWTLLFRVPAPSLIIRHFVVGWDAPGDLVEQVKNVMSKASANVLALRLRSLLTRTSYPSYSPADVNILYLRGTNDRLVKDRSFQRIKQFVPRLQCADIPAPHSLVQRRPVEAWKAIAAFAENLGGT